jgi:threonine dehydratase
LSITLADIESARRVIQEAIVRTPMLPAPKLSALTGAQVFVKYENLQVTNSFKDRGALAKLASLSDAERACGVIAMSAGNHAQAVAYHASRLGIPATIVMPVTTPFVKVAATRAYGAEVVLDGETMVEAQACCEEIRRERGLTLVHPYDDARVIAGQGTIAVEMLEDQGDLDCIVIPIGGGGLIAGNALAARAMRPQIEIVGTEAALYPSVWNALTGEQRPIGGATLAEGIAVKNVGALTLPVIRELVSEIILVDEAHLERAVNAHLTLQKTMAGGRALPVLPPCWPSPTAFAAEKSGSFCAAVISTPESSPPSWCANLSAKRKSLPFASPFPTGRVCSVSSRRGWANWAPISWRSTTAGCFSMCRPRAPSST